MYTEELEGIVEDINDPAKAGRIKASLPSMGGAIYPLWIEPIFLSGWISMPEVGDRVSLVMPDSEEAIEFAEEVKYRGKAYDEAHGVEEEFKTNYGKRRGYKTKGGHVLIFDDQDMFIHLFTPQDYSLLIDQGSGEVTLAHKGSTLISITSSGIFLGSKSASEPMVLGALWQTMMGTLLNAILSHTHAAPGSPMDPVNAAAITAIKGDIASGNHLSNFIKGQKIKP